MKKLVFIEANTSGSGMLAFEKARQLNIEPIFFTNNPTRYKGLQEKHVQTVICNTNSLDELQNKILPYLEGNDLLGITTTSEFYIYTIARLNEYFHLEGNSSFTISNVRNKAKMRELLNNYDFLYCPDFFVIEDEEDLTSIKNELKLPCIVKPVDDSGSNLVLKCNSYGEICRHIKHIKSSPYNSRGQKKDSSILIEEFIEGEEYSIECLSYKMQHHIIGITKKIVDNEPYFVEVGHYFPAQLENWTKQLIEQSIIQILNLIEWQFGPSHIEFKIKAKKLCIIEFNGRLAGGMIPEIIKYATSLDLLQEQIKIVCGVPPTPEVKVKQVAAIRHLAPQKSGKICLSFPERGLQNIAAVKIFIKNDIFIPKATNAYGRIGYLIATGSNYQEVKTKLDEGEKALKICIKENAF